jgi:ectoine hydroxylase-related dioxygenase (phytanoyl-CoA dioxygenase family)
MISETEIGNFQEHGILLVKNFVPKKLVKQAQEYVMSELERMKIRARGKWRLRQFDNIPTFQIGAKISQSILPSESLNQIMTRDLVEAMGKLANTNIVAAKQQPTLLFTPPQKLPWGIPATDWHVDVAARPDDKIPGVQAFVILSDLLPKGGATMAIAGSHRILNLRKEDSSRDLFSPNAPNRDRFLKPTQVNGVKIEIIEMVGKAGDVYLMDMRILHSPSINASNQPRLMLTNRYLPDYL